MMWQCHGCGAFRDDEWISVAHLKVRVDSQPTPLQLNARYCNDRSACLVLVAAVLEKWATPLRDLDVRGAVLHHVGPMGKR